MAEQFTFSTAVTKDYELQGLISRGQKTLIYKALQRSLDRAVAIKVLKAEDGTKPSPDLHERFLREAKCLAKLSHPNVVELYDFGIDGECPYIVEEFLQGQSLTTLIKDGKPLEANKALAIGRSIASALVAVHEAKVLHRDLKPANIFIIDEEGHFDLQVKLIDFGLAKRPGQDATLTERGHIVSSLAFAAPEQILCEEPTPKSDLYALGTILYLLLSGTYPFRLDNRSMLQGKPTEAAPSLKERVSSPLPAGLVEVVDSLLARIPQERPASAEEVLNALEKLGQKGAQKSSARKKTKKQQPKKQQTQAQLDTGANAAVSKGQRKNETPQRRFFPVLAICALLVTIYIVGFTNFFKGHKELNQHQLVTKKPTTQALAAKRQAKVTQFKVTSVGATSLEIFIEANVPVTASLTIASKPKARFERTVELTSAKHLWRQRIGNIPRKKKYTLAAVIRHGEKDLIRKKVDFATGQVTSHIVLASVQFKTEAPLADFSKLWSENVFARANCKLWQGKLFVSLNNYGLFCLDVKERKQVWRQRKLKGLRGLRVFGDTLYGLDKDRKLRAINAIDGKERWATDLPRDVKYKLYSSPAGLLLWKPFVGPFCICPKEGKYLGKIDDADFSIDSWTLSQNGILWLARARDELWAYNAKDGSKMKSLEISLPSHISSPIVTYKEKLFVGLEDGSIYGGTTRSKDDLGRSRVSDSLKKLSVKLPGPIRYLTHHQDLLFAYSDSPPTVLCIDSEKDQLVWRRQVKDKAATDLVVHRQRVYFAGEQKHIHCLDERYGWYLWKKYTGLRHLFGLIPWEYGVIYCSHVGDIVALSDA